MRIYLEKGEVNESKGEKKRKRLKDNGGAEGKGGRRARGKEEEKGKVGRRGIG